MKHVEERLQVPWNERGIWNAEWRAVWCGSIWETKAFLTSARVRLSSRRERSEARRGLRRREGLRREPRRPTRGDNVFKFHVAALSPAPGSARGRSPADAARARRREQPRSLHSIRTLQDEEQLSIQYGSRHDSYDYTYTLLMVEHFLKMYKDKADVLAVVQSCVASVANVWYVWQVLYSNMLYCEIIFKS